jgi:hypothetical protein
MSKDEEGNNQENITVSKEFIEEFATAKETITNLSNEIKTLRPAKNEEINALKQEIEKLKGNSGENNGGSGGDTKDINSEIEQALTKRELEAARRAKEVAIAEFRNSHAEFSSDNDPGDFKFNKFKQEIAKFNLDNLTTKEEVTARLKEIYEFANRGTKPNDSKMNDFAATRKGSSTAPDVGDYTLSDKERRLCKMQNITEEAFVKLKEKRPAYIANLIRFID